MALILLALSLASFPRTNASPSPGLNRPSRASKKSNWQDRLRKELTSLSQSHPGKFALYLKDMNTGEEFSFNGEENWYLASTVKVPVAMEVLRQIDAGNFSLDDEMEIIETDYVDGNGPLKSMSVGQKVSLRYLIQQMIIWSDNMATDMLLRKVGLDKVNQLINKVATPEFPPITTLKDVRRHVYGGLHPKAMELTGHHLIELRNIQDPAKKIERFSSLLQLGKSKMNLPGLDEAYKNYYQSGLNSASAKNYSKILEAVFDEKLLTSESRNFLLTTMLQTQTGKKRIKAGLKAPWVFAHKTGTQYQRIGDVGYILQKDNPGRKPIILVSFVKDVADLRTSSQILESLGKIILQSGVL